MMMSTDGEKHEKSECIYAHPLTILTFDWMGLRRMMYEHFEKISEHLHMFIEKEMSPSKAEEMEQLIADMTSAIFHAI